MKTLLTSSLMVLILSILAIQWSAGMEPAQSSLTLTIQTDKPSYSPGSMVYIFGTVKNSNNNPIANNEVGIQATDPQNNTIFLDIAVSAPNGTYQDSFRLSPASALGTYQVFATTTATGYPTAQNKTTFEVGKHNVVVTSLILNKTVLIQGSDLAATVTLTNNGTFTETFSVTLYVSQHGTSWSIYTFANVTLAPEGATTLTITGLRLGVGFYTLSARVYNAYFNNTYTGGTVWVMPITLFRSWFLLYKGGGWGGTRFWHPAIPI